MMTVYDRVSVIMCVVSRQ